MMASESQIRTTRRSVIQALASWRPTFEFRFETGIVAFAVGIVGYFALPVELSLGGLSLITALCAASLIFVGGRLFGGVAICALLIGGVFWSSVVTHLRSPNPVNLEQRMSLTGWVSDIDQGGRMRRLTIDVRSAETSRGADTPKRVRIRVGRAFPQFDIGEGIAVDAVIGPLPGPAIPNGYDPGRRAYFDGLAGSGFAIADGQRVDVELSVIDRLRVRLMNSRRSIAARVLDVAPSVTAGLQAALLTGLRDDIPEPQTDSLRASGLAHILAISGLHMGMVAFGVYVVASVTLASIERLSRGRDVRKIAAIIGIIAATLYLGLSGASVATQRAYIMVTIGFLALLLDRRVISLRSVAVAALLTLLIRPEALLSVGFQMSFAAVASMVVIFRAWQDRWPKQRAQGLRDRIVSFYGSLFGTSLVAGFATGIFALLHFGRIANYGLIANLAAMSVFPVVMALGIVSLLLMPFGLDGLTLYLMSLVLQFMLIVSDWVSGLPGSVATVKASQPWVIALYGFGFALACLATRKAVVIGLVSMSIALMGWVRAPVYDLRISEDGRVSIIGGEGGQTSSRRADRYGRDQFARASGTPKMEWSDYRDAFADCDVLACRFRLNNTTVTVVEEPSEVPDACRDSDIVVLPTRQAGPVARRACAAKLIDRRELNRSGGYHIRTAPSLRMQPIQSRQRSNRPWGLND